MMIARNTVRIRWMSTKSGEVLRLHEVTPRDGLQNEKKRLSVADKVELINKIVLLKPQSIEVASFVRADLVPNMAGATELCQRLAESPKFVEFKKAGRGVAALIPNMKGLEEFLKNKNVLDTAVVLVSCSDSHSKANVNRTMKEALVATLGIIDNAKQEGLQVRAYASLAFGCPFEGEVPRERVLDLLGEFAQHGADKLMLADTLGVGTPEQVRGFVTGVKEHLGVDVEDIGLHLHDSHHKAHLNVAEAWALGIRDFDAAIGGAGGCNFAPGSKGNISIEKLLRTIDSPEATQSLNKSVLKSINRELSKLLERELEQ